MTEGEEFEDFGSVDRIELMLLCLSIDVTRWSIGACTQGSIFSFLAELRLQF
jgi:hypothetical protein